MKKIFFGITIAIVSTLLLSAYGTARQQQTKPSNDTNPLIGVWRNMCPRLGEIEMKKFISETHFAWTRSRNGTVLASANGTTHFDGSTYIETVKNIIPGTMPDHLIGQQAIIEVRFDGNDRHYAVGRFADRININEVWERVQQDTDSTNILYQIAAIKQLTNDIKLVTEIHSPAQAREFLQNGTLQTYSRQLSESFSSIRLTGIDLYLFKGDEFAVYMSNAHVMNFMVGVTDDVLVVGAQTSPTTTQLPVIIFMPTEPKNICFAGLHRRNIAPHRIYGLTGNNTLLTYVGENVVRIYTDLSYININQRDVISVIRAYYAGNIQVNINAEFSAVNIIDYNSESIDVHLNMRESSLRRLILNPESNVGTVHITGSMREHRGYMRALGNEGEITHSGTADSLVIHLINTSEIDTQFTYTISLTGRYEDIQFPDNVVVERE